MRFDPADDVRARDVRPALETATISGYGPRAAEPALNLITGYPWSTPYEELRLKGR